MTKAFLRKLVLPAVIAIIPVWMSANLPFKGWYIFDDVFPGLKGAGVSLGFITLVVLIGLLPFHRFYRSLSIKRRYSVVLLLFTGTIAGYITATIFTGGYFQYASIGLLPALVTSIIWLLINLDFKKENHA